MKLILFPIVLSFIVISFLIIGLTIFQPKSSTQSKKGLPMPSPMSSLESLPMSKSEADEEDLLVLASIPYWDHERAVASLKRNVDVIDEISLFWYSLRSDGSVAKYSSAPLDFDLIEFAKKHEVKALVLFANLPDEKGNWDSIRVDLAIGTPDARAKHIKEIVETVERLGVDGANIDYENLREDQKDNFTVFIHELALELHKRGKRLRVPVFVRTDITETHGEDLVALSRYVDELGFMAYNEHYETSEPGPIASISWVRENINFAINLGIPRNVIFLGIPLYGYDWPKSGGSAKEIEFDQALYLVQKHNAEVNFDQKLASPYFEYDNRVVWFENAASVREKIKLAKELGLYGIAFWRLGGEDPKVWEELEKFR